jgi:DNA mismatch repair protein MutH
MELETLDSGISIVVIFVLGLAIGRFSARQRPEQHQRSLVILLSTLALNGAGRLLGLPVEARLLLATLVVLSGVWLLWTTSHVSQRSA